MRAYVCRSYASVVAVDFRRPCAARGGDHPATCAAVCPRSRAVSRFVVVARLVRAVAIWRNHAAVIGACALVGCGDPRHGGDDLDDDGESSGASTAATSSTAPGHDVGSDDGETASSDGGSSDTGALGCTLTDATTITLASGMAVVHRDGQSWVSWRDRAEGTDGESYRYRLYRAATPIASDEDLVGLTPVVDGILNHSGQLFGGAFTPAQRLDATLPMAVREDLGEPLPAWSGLAVATTEDDDCAWYAVVATDLDGNALESIAPGVNATIDPIAEAVAPRRPVLVYESSARGKYSSSTEITGTPNLPLVITLHGSQAQGGGAGDYGDYWSYFGDATMGWRAGLPGVFSVEETHSGPQTLIMRNRDAIVQPSGDAALETMWFGYVAELEGARHAYPFTERRLEWMIPWVIAHYAADAQRVYLSGGSMGAWGTITFGLHRPELFAALFPDRPRFRQTSLTSVTTEPAPDDTLPDGTPWSEHHDAIAFVTSYRGDDLPFVGWNCGRQDGFATWQEQVDMVHAMTELKLGFAFAWNDGDHSEGSNAAAAIAMWYPPERFARDLGYPAFSHSSIDDDPGPGDAASGDLVGGINLGFSWTDPTDTPDTWSSAIANALAVAPMTVDVTPRRAQQFRLDPGESVDFTTSRGDAGTIVADERGLVTAVAVEIVPGESTTLTLTRP
ncbi:MAG TPA: hypothetical protein VG755_25220 [Nannocystaceae bacterium]|nr:hypothetical protein [Nannocystaceae bacterium]